MLDGNAAAVEAVSAAGVKVYCAYPITPQSPISEKLSYLVDSGQSDAKCIRVESEHSAMSVVLGAQMTGVRAVTATSSVGLALMQEMLSSVSGMRMPTVMPVVNRSLSAPWSLWCDHSDTMGARDTGWLQYYSENVQEVYDLLIAAFRIAEHENVLTPAMVGIDGFYLSHSTQKVNMLKPADVLDFVGEYVRRNVYLDPEDPMVVSCLTPTADYTEVKYQQKVGFDNALGVSQQVFDEFEKRTGRKLTLVEGYRTQDAEAVIVTLGSMSGTAKHTVNKMREQGIKAGVCKITCFRPFPYEMIQDILKDVPKIAVLDRSAGLGAQGAPVWLEIVGALAGTPGDRDIRSYGGGLAGRDISMKTIKDVFADLMEKPPQKEAVWIDVRDDAMNVREVECYV